MVQIQSYGQSIRHTQWSRSHHAREYWMLRNEGGGTIDTKKQRLDRYGAKYNSTVSRHRSEALCHRAERGLYIYDKLSVSELRAFVSARQLKTTKPSMKKIELVTCLEQADEDATFRFVDLPPELRVLVYEFHLQGLNTMHGYLSTTPPVTRVSKLLRKESTPLFYQNCTFHLDLCGTPQAQAAARYFAQSRVASIRSIRKLYVVGCLSENRVMRFALEVGRDGMLREVAQHGVVSKYEYRVKNAHLIEDWEGSPDLSIGRARAEARLQTFYQKLVDRHKQAVSEETVNTGDSIDDEGDESVKPGLCLQSSDLADLQALFDRVYW